MAGFWVSRWRKWPNYNMFSPNNLPTTRTLPYISINIVIKILIQSKISSNVVRQNSTVFAFLQHEIIPLTSCVNQIDSCVIFLKGIKLSSKVSADAQSTLLCCQVVAKKCAIGTQQAISFENENGDIIHIFYSNLKCNGRPRSTPRKEVRLLHPCPDGFCFDFQELYSA